MSPTRLYSPVALSPGSDIELSGDQARYISRVLRLKPQDEITLFDGRGGEYRVLIRSFARNKVVLQVAEHHDNDVESPLEIRLLQAMSRGERMDIVVQKATELGVHRITPLLTEYTVVKLDENRAEKRVQHWQRVAASACEQCGRNRLPVIDFPQPLRNWLGDNNEMPGTRILLRPGGRGSLKSVSPPENPVTILIGPEGGFSETEYELAEATGFESVGFGPRVLRTETAAVAVISALQVLHGDLS